MHWNFSLFFSEQEAAFKKTRKEAKNEFSELKKKEFFSHPVEVEHHDFNPNHLSVSDLQKTTSIQIIDELTNCFHRFEEPEIKKDITLTLANIHSPI